MGYAVFLLVLTVPALEWLLASVEPKQRVGDTTDTTPDGEPGCVMVASHGVPRGVRMSILAVLLAATVAQAVDFQITFWRRGRDRQFAFDVMYKPLYDAAVARPERPIYLENGQWGPAYMDAYWYATVEGTSISEFVRLAEGAKPPSGAIVLSSTSDCQNCEVIQKSGAYELFKVKMATITLLAIMLGFSSRLFMLLAIVPWVGSYLSLRGSNRENFAQTPASVWQDVSSRCEFTGLS